MPFRRHLEDAISHSMGRAPQEYVRRRVAGAPGGEPLPPPPAGVKVEDGDDAHFRKQMALLSRPLEIPTGNKRQQLDPLIFTSEKELLEVGEELLDAKGAPLVAIALQNMYGVAITKGNFFGLLKKYLIQNHPAANELWKSLEARRRADEVGHAHRGQQKRLFAAAPGDDEPTSTGRSRNKKKKKRRRQER